MEGEGRKKDIRLPPEKSGFFFQQPGRSTRTIGRPA